MLSMLMNNDDEAYAEELFSFGGRQ